MNSKLNNYLQTYINKAKCAKDRFFSRFAQWLISHRVTANQVSIAGGIVGLSALIGLQISTGLFLFLAFTWRIIDMIDGTVARASKKHNWWIDPLVDRIVGGTYLFTFVIASGDVILFFGGLSYIFFSLLQLVLKFPALRFPEDILIVLYFTQLFSTAGIIILICGIWNIKEAIIYAIKWE